MQTVVFGTMRTLLPAILSMCVFVYGCPRHADALDCAKAYWWNFDRIDDDPQKQREDAEARAALANFGPIFVDGSLGRAMPATANTTLQYGSMQADPPNLEFKYLAKQYENWEVAAWENDTRIKMKAFINGRTSYDQEAELVRKESGWTLDLGKKTDRPR